MDSERAAGGKAWFLLALVLPIVIGVWALQTHRIEFKLGEAGACALLLLACRCRYRLPDFEWIVGAFVASMIGDYFLSHRSGHPQYFVYGIGAFFVAHLGYLGFALKHGRLNLLGLTLLLVVFLPFFGFGMKPAIADPILLAAVLLYLLISCVSMAAAIGLRWPARAKAGFVAGIGLILFSDTLIALSEFVHYRAGNAWILPTYYLAHVCVTAALFLAPEPASGRG